MQVASFTYIQLSPLLICKHTIVQKSTKLSIITFMYSKRNVYILRILQVEYHKIVTCGEMVRIIEFITNYLMRNINVIQEEIWL